MKQPRLATAQELPAAPRQARSAGNRQKLLDTARALFREKGYTATSINDITTAAGTAAGAFYIYFRSKQQLLVVLMNELMDRLGAVELRPQPASDMRAALRAFVAALFRADFEYYGVIRAWQEASLTDPELRALRATIESWSEARILRVFRLLQTFPHARRQRDLPAFARMMDRHFWALLARGATLRRRELNREARIAADVVYHYLFE